MRDEIYKIIKETNTTTILVTHDINDSLNIADRILIFKAGVLQQYDDPVNMYCEPANCYCAKVLGDLNQIDLDDKTYYIRPENIKIVKDSDNKVTIEKCFFFLCVMLFLSYFQSLSSDNGIIELFKKKDLSFFFIH